MTTITLSDILDDLRIAEEGLRKFERRYWISSTHFYNLYSQGYSTTAKMRTAGS